MLLKSDLEITVPDVDGQLVSVLKSYRRTLGEEHIFAMLLTISPLVRRAGKLWRIKSVHPRKAAFQLNPVLAEEAEGLTEFATLYTLHPYEDPAVFEARIVDVLAMIPPHLIKQIKAFETCGPRGVEAISRQQEAVRAGFHVAVTTLYA